MPTSKPLLEGLVLSHSKFRDALERLHQAYLFADYKVDAEGLAIIGESGTGKTSVLRTFIDDHPARREPDGMKIPVLFATVPSRPTVKSLAAVLLEALHAPDSERGTENEKTRRVRVLIREVGTRVVIIDEFQHFYDQGTKKIMHHVADWLKILIDETRTTLVIAGLPSALAVIDVNKQLMRRFSSQIRLKNFDWEVPEERDEFCELISNFGVTLAEKYKTVDFDSEDIAYRFWLASDGSMGYLTKILRQAERNAMVANSEGIALEDLHLAQSQSVWTLQRRDDLVHPFRKDFSERPTIDLVRRVHQIGEEIAPPQLTGKRRPYQPRIPSSSQMLTAK